jgi:DNA segregation ATPase FtsK/SpoIIIE-like protein
MGGNTVMYIGGNTMKKLLFGAILLALVMAVPLPTMAQVNIDAGPPVTSEYLEAPQATSEHLEAPPVTSEYLEEPDVIPLPETDNVYVVPDLDIDVFFWNGWWWRPWQGGWYRSQYYSRGWGHYGGIPTFYYDVDPGWRGYYRDRNWYGNPWRYERIRSRNLHQNWRQWHNDRHWERQRTWGVQGYRPRPQQQRQELRRQREQEYYQRSEVRQYQQQLRQQQKRQPQVQQQRQQQQRQQLRQQQRSEPQVQQQRQKQRREPQVQQQRQQFQEKVQRPQKQEQRPQVQQQRRPRSQEKPQTEEGDLRK